MALAFKRAQLEAEQAIENTNKSVTEWYKPSVTPALVVDFDSVKAVEGVSTQNPNKVEGPKNITICKWICDNYNHFHSIWGNVKSKDDSIAIPLMHKHIEKVVMHLDDKSNGKKYNSYSAEMKGKELHVTVHFDFENYPQQFNCNDEKNGVSISQFVWEYLNQVANIDFELVKAKLETYQYSALADAKKVIKEKTGKDVPIKIEYEAIEKITGKSVYYSNKPPVPNNYLALNFLADGKGLNSLAYGIGELCKDKLGKEAFLETFDSISVTVEGGVTAQQRSGPHEVKKNGKVLQVIFKVSFDINASNWSSSSSTIGKQLEGLL